MRLLLAMLVALPGMALAKEECRLGALKAKQNTARVIDCPAEIQPLIDRAFGCQHWTGEEPYDNARAHEIDTAITELKCDTLSLDYDAALKKYADRPDVTGALETADREYSLEF